MNRISKHFQPTASGHVTPESLRGDTNRLDALDRRETHVVAPEPGILPMVAAVVCWFAGVAASVWLIAYVATRAVLTTLGL